MKVQTNSQITLLQYILIITGLQVNVSIVGLPRKLAEAAGTDGWMSILPGWVLSAAAGLLMIRVMKNRPSSTLPDLISAYMGKWTGKIVALLLSLYYFNIMYDGLIRTMLLTKIWLLPNISNYVLMIMLLIPTFTIAKHGPRILGRYAEFIILISAWVPFIFLFTMKHAHWLHMIPMFKEGWTPILSGVKETIYPSLGMSATFILYPYLQKKEKAAAGILAATGLSFAIYLFITVICFLNFSPDEISQFNDPIVSVLKTIEFKFIERIEVPFITFLLLLFSLVWIPGIYLTTFTASWLFGKNDHRPFLTWLCILLAAVTMIYSPTFNQVDKMETMISWVGFGAEYLFPLFLFLYLQAYKSFKRGRIP